MIFHAGGVCGSTVSPLQCRSSRLTTSFGIICGKLGIIIDHGYGIQNVVNFLEGHNIRKIIALQTHFHSDHIAALPLNRFLFRKARVNHRIFVPRLGAEDFHTIWKHIFSPSNWPVCPDLRHIDIAHFDPDPLDPVTFFKEDGVTISALKFNHTGGSVGYRVEYNGFSVVIATDHEPNPRIGRRCLMDHAYARFVDRADALIADIQHRQKEHEGKIGVCGGLPRRRWGHGTPELIIQTLNFCSEPPKAVFATHHDPDRTESDLTKLTQSAAIKFADAGYQFSSLCDGETILVNSKK